jgi:hypothetical protein
MKGNELLTSLVSPLSQCGPRMFWYDLCLATPFHSCIMMVLHHFHPLQEFLIYTIQLLHFVIFVLWCWHVPLHYQNTCWFCYYTQFS